MAAPPERQAYQRAYYQRHREKLSTYRVGWQRRKKYGITQDQYEAKRATQDGLCAICGRHQEVLYVDHCHASGMVRGLLCHQCNVLLGMCDDETAVLQNAVAYLNYHHDGE